MWLSIFYIAIPFGYALGFAGGGVWTGLGVISGSWNWKVMFLFIACLMVPCILLFSMVPAPDSLEEMAKQQEKDRIAYGQLRSSKVLNDNLWETEGPRHDSMGGTPLFKDNDSRTVKTVASNPDSSVEKLNDLEHFKETMFVLFTNRIYVLAVLGYAATIFVIGGFSFYGMVYIEEEYGYNSTQAGFMFGGLSAFTGIFGTAFGGWLLDFERQKLHVCTDADSARLGLYLVTIFTLISLPMAVIGFIFTNFWIFYATIAVAEFFMFAATPPINSVLLWVVAVKYRPMAMALSVFATHILGDAISPVILGGIKDGSGEWRSAMLLGACWLGWSILFYIFAYRTAKNVWTDEAKIEAFLPTDASA